MEKLLCSSSQRIPKSHFAEFQILHLSGDTMGFYPVNAIQIRNAHSYLADFKDELSVQDN